MPRALRWGGMVVLALVLLVLAAGWLADWWLESAGGRDLLERELSAAVGAPVRLAGEYRFRLVPRIVVAGEGLAVGAAAAALEVEEFRAVVGLLPLLRGELRIDAVELADGRADVGALAELGTAGPETTEAEAGTAVFPAVGELLLERIRVSIPEQTVTLHIERLYLEGIRPGRDIPAEIDARLVADEELLLRATVEGALRIEPETLDVAFDLQPATIDPDGGNPIAIRGAVRWETDSGTLTADLAHEAADYRVETTAEVRFGGTLTGDAVLSFRQSAPERGATAEFGFAERGDHYVLDPVAIDLGGPRLTGRGCVLTAGDLALHLALEAETMDFGHLSLWMAGDGTAGGALPELPFEVGIGLTIGEARMAGVAAGDIRVVVGAEPACPAG